MKHIKSIHFIDEYEVNYYFANRRNSMSCGCFIPSPINELHIIFNANMQSYHMKLDEKNQKCIKLPAEINETIPLANSRMMYIASQQHLFVFGGVEGHFDKGARGYYSHINPIISDNIWCCRITEQNQLQYNWTLYGIKMPYKTERFDAVQVFDGIVIIIYFHEECRGEIWCLNTWNKILYKSS
eukprot:523444_1